VAKAKEEKERITKLEEEVSDIKNMLKQILEKVS
jgi:polyhydroxyalkanoate synthesis regulator phasin